MNKAELLDRLTGFKARLMTDVVPAFADKGSEFGRERFAAWRRQFTLFLDDNLPGKSSALDAKLQHSIVVVRREEPPAATFMRRDGKSCVAFIESLILDVQNDELETASTVMPVSPSDESPAALSRKVFIVHGHDQSFLAKAARFVEKLGLEAVILHEQANMGMTVIEKIEAHTDVGFAIVLYTPDDKGNTVAEADLGHLNLRARQNVIFEHGYLIAKLSRSHVVPLMGGNLEIPSDIRGVVYVDDSNWQVDIAKEMLAVGYDIDFNRLLRS